MRLQTLRINMEGWARSSDMASACRSRSLSEPRRNSPRRPTFHTTENPPLHIHRRVLSLIGLGHRFCFVDDDGATFHDPTNVVQNDVDVRQRIAFDGDNVGEETGCYRTQ